jgi:hypothetical protein
MRGTRPRMTECVTFSGTRIGFTASFVSERRHSGLARRTALGADPFARARMTLEMDL